LLCLLHVTLTYYVLPAIAVTKKVRERLLLNSTDSVETLENTDETAILPHSASSPEFSIYQPLLEVATIGCPSNEVSFLYEVKKL
jgi:hypothetical protein